MSVVARGLVDYPAGAYRKSPQASKSRTAFNRSANRGAVPSLQINETLRLFGSGRGVNGSSVNLGDVAQLERFGGCFGPRCFQFLVSVDGSNSDR
jgi:hypothetical protein